MDFSKLLHWPFILEHPGDINDMQWLIVKGMGLIVVVFVILKFIWPSMIQPSLTQRQLDIAHQADQIAETLKETEQLRNDYRNRLAKIEDEAKARLEEAVKEADDLRNRILAEAKTTAESLENRGRMELERERAKAIVGLQRKFVEDVIGAAQYAAEGSLDSASHDRLVSDFVGKVGSPA